MAVIVEKNNDIEYYYMMNELYDFIPLAQLDNKTFTAIVVGAQRNPLQLTSDIFGSLELEYESLPENIMEGSLVEITLGKVTEERNELYAQSIIVK